MTATQHACGWELGKQDGVKLKVQIKKTDKIGRSLCKGDTGEYQGHFQPVRHQTLKQQTVLNFYVLQKVQNTL